MDLRSGRFTGDWMTNLGEPAYPAELWEHIFSFLPGLSLNMVRLVCRRWRDIVGSSLRLLNRQQVTLERFDENYFYSIDEYLVVPPLVPVPNLILDNWIIFRIHWWPEISWKLRDLSLFRCTVDMPMFLKMLKQAPNLRCLRLRALQLHAYESYCPDFRLENMRQLTMDTVEYKDMLDADVIDTFVKIFPRLQDFQMRIPTSQQVLVQAVHKLQGTLQSLEVIPKGSGNSLLPQLCRLKELRLKRLSLDTLDTFCTKDWEQLHRAQPLLEELVIDVNRCSIMLDIVKTASTIKALSLYLIRSIPMSFLNELPQLRFLEINGHTFDRYAPLPLGGGPQMTEPVRCPALKYFRLFRMTFVGFLEFFAHSPQIETILLEDVKLEDPTPSTTTFPHLRHLDISDCLSVRSILVHIFTNSPLLEHVRLLHVTEIDDETIGILCQRATRLRKLEIDECLALTDTSGTHIIKHCAELQELRLYRNRVSLGMVQQLRQTRNIRVCYRCYQEPARWDWLENA